MNGILVIDKQPDWTSNDVVCKLRGVLREKRIGHGGTLDPMATGVLPVFVGRATRGVEFCENAEKEYIAGIRFGLETDTLDSTGTVLRRSGSQPKWSEVEAILPRFTGEIQQVPPMYSALKVGGQKLYDLARRGIEVERKARPVTIRELKILEEREEELVLKVVCSKGTYVRTLCHDIGQALGCGAVMSALRRTRAGDFDLTGAVTIEEVIAAKEAGTAESLLRPIDGLFRSCPAVTIGPREEKKCRNGNSFPMPRLADGQYRVYGQSGAFLMLGKAKDEVLHTVKSFFEV